MFEHIRRLFELVRPLPKNPVYQLGRGLTRITMGTILALSGVSVFAFPLFFGLTDTTVGGCRCASNWLNGLTSVAFFGRRLF
ncbi:MAG: hypothetical protein JW727_04845 [Candidatus Aenigmarchaeota archaeon]|nr:hypothetical protein [Candidatus Aenigmarchaeota archaeon]